MRRFFHFLHAISAGCGRLPLWGALALVAVSRLGAALTPPPKPPVAVKAAPNPDLVTIEKVLAVRAPDLGLTLRQQLAQAVNEEALRAGYDPMLILAIIDVESDFDRDALSNKGARGLMQIQPTTLKFVAAQEGLRLTRAEIAADPSVQVRLGVRYLKQLQDRFGGNLDLALMAYNAGPRKIHNAARRHRLAQFQEYPSRVRRDFRHFRRHAGLDTDWALAQRDTGTRAHAASLR